MQDQGWNRVTQPKLRRGLRVKKLKVVNKAVLAKLRWGTIKQRNQLQAKEIHAKYGQQGIIADFRKKQSIGVAVEDRKWAKDQVLN